MRKLFLTTLLCLTASLLFAQVTSSSALYKTLRSNDSLLFQVGFNTCDISQFEKLLSDNFEFYHDKAGITNSKAAFIASVQNGLCKLDYKPRRELVAGSLEVYPLEKNGTLYGAIQLGEHKFYAIEKGKPMQQTDEAKFTHVWLLENGRWQLSRGLSYAHQGEPVKAAKVAADEQLLFSDRAETEEWLRKHNIPALGIGYIQDGKIVKANVYGVLAKGKPAPDNAIFTVASLTKPITAMVALRLVAEGKWQLDEPLATYWTDPDIAADPRTKKLTTRLILSHRSGFPNWRWESADHKLAFMNEPGTTYHYSGEGFEYLRKALENKFHKPLDQLARELVFKPAHMNDTKFYWGAGIDTTRFANAYAPDGTLYEDASIKNTSPSAAYGVLTTVEDYTKFLLYVLKGGGLKKTVYRDMVADQTPMKAHQYYGLGWMVDEIPGEKVLTHGGVGKGTQTIVFLLPKAKKGLVIFTNCGNGGNAYVPVMQKFLGKDGQEIIAVESH